MDKQLTDTECNLIRAYRGHGTIKDAALATGLTYGYARQILCRPHVKKHLRDRNGLSVAEKEAFGQALITDRVERQIWLTVVMYNEEEPMSKRLRACEILCRMQGDFAHTVVHEGGEKPITMETKPFDLLARINQLKESAADLDH